MTCGTCRHYQGLTAPDVGGLCRRNAPSSLVLTRFKPSFGTNVPAWPNEAVTAWPPVNAERDYCGEYTARDIEEGTRGAAGV